MERMFERDKDDLRNLGITIEVGSFDPLFEDEVGYRIRPESYQADIDSISPRELSLISLATQAWQGAVLNSSALSALVKLKSLGIDSDFDSIPAMAPVAHISDSNFASIIDAIAERRVISFSYLNVDMESESRAIEPFGAGTKGGFWYVAGRDLDKKALRLFRLDRVDSQVKSQGKAGSYEIPKDFVMADALTSPIKSNTAQVKVRRDKAHALRNRAQLVDEGDEWSTLEIDYSEESELVSDVLWHGDDAVIITPESARYAAMKALNEIVKSHG
jgi:proteasome accessory factor B